MSTLITNIKFLYQVYDEPPKRLAGTAMSELPYLQDAFLFMKDGLIADFGLMSDLNKFDADHIINAQGKSVLPAWCDSHTHLVFAQSRVQEFVDRINGLSYQDIAAKGGGILNSAQALRTMSEDLLFESAKNRVKNLLEIGTSAIEIKTGYGLDLDSEMKMLRVIKRLKDYFSIAIKATFLAAHAVPKEFLTTESYVSHIIDDMLPVVGSSGLADFIDVFCEKGYFNVNQMERILIAAACHGLQPKVHVNQFNSFGGVATAIKHNALSIDHLEIITEDDITAMKNSESMPVALPGCSFFLGIPYTSGRKLIDEGLPLALASDFNPGSSPSGNLNFVFSLACIKMRLSPEEALNALTINAAYAMGLEQSHGTITIGKKAHVIITRPIEQLSDLPYHFGQNMISNVLINGNLI